MGITSKNWYANSHDVSAELKPRPIDKGFLLILFSLIALGLVQVYSASFIFAQENFGDGLWFFKRQVFFTALSLFIVLLTSQLSLVWIEKFSVLLWVLAVLGVALTLVPGLGVKVGGATRWLSFGVFRFEPSELLKVSFPFLLAYFISREESRFGRWKWFVRSLMLAAPLMLLLKQPDFGTVVICVGVTILTFFCFGLKGRYLFLAVLALLPVFFFLVVREPYRYARLVAFVNPWQDPDRGGFQVIQSMLGFYSGGLTGTGLGLGMGKLFFLPEAHTDFTLAVLGEELGFVGIFAVFVLYAGLIFKGFQTCLHAPSRFTQVASLGLTIGFFIQLIINSGVAMGMLPPKGLTLPFLSYGGSSLVVTSFAFGVLLNIRRFEGITPVRRYRPNQDFV